MNLYVLKLLSDECCLILSSYIDTTSYVYNWKIAKNSLFFIPFVFVYLVVDVETLSPKLQVRKMIDQNQGGLTKQVSNMMLKIGKTVHKAVKFNTDLLLSKTWRLKSKNSADW